MRGKKLAPITRQPLIDPLELPAPPSRSHAVPANVPSIRTGTTRRKPWTSATGSPDTLRGKAIFYLLKAFDYKDAWMLDTAEVSLAKVVCNLRHFYRQDVDSTVDLVQTYFNPRTLRDWSPEAIRLTWEMVEPFTPSLGLRTERARAKQHKRTLEEEVREFLAITLPGGRILDHDLLDAFREWDPSLPVTSNAFTRAVQAITGEEKVPSDSKRYWVGFHLPTSENVSIRNLLAA